MLRTGNASLRPREMALPGKCRAGIAPRRIKNSGFCRFLSPCFATGCHTFNFKIATAAKRPRNDTKLERFNLDNGRFSIFAVIFACCRSASFFKHFVSEIVPISRKTNQFCHCEEGAIFAPDAAIFNESICHPGTKYGRMERNRTLGTSDYHHGLSSGVWIRQGIFSRSEWRSGSPRGHRRSRICPPSRRPRRSPPERPTRETRAAPVC